MPTARGFLTKAALRREALTTARVWPAAAPAAVTALLPLPTENLKETLERVSPRQIADYPGQPAVTARRVAGPLSLLGTYNGLETVWALALGHMARRYGGTSFPQNLATGVYKHRFEVDRLLASKGWEAGSGFRAGSDALKAGRQKIRRGTLVIDKDTGCWEATSAMVTSLDVEAAPDGVSLGLDVVARAMSLSSMTNANLDSLTDPGFEPVDLTHLVFRIGAYSASVSLDSSNVLTISGLRVSLDNHLQAPLDPHNGLYISEPERREAPSVSGTITLPRYTANTLLTWASGSTLLMADAVFTGPLIPSTATAYKLSVYLPCFVLEALDVATSGPGKQAMTVPFRAYAPASAAAGFPTSTKNGPLMVEVISGQANHALLAT